MSGGDKKVTHTETNLQGFFSTYDVFLSQGIKGLREGRELCNLMTPEKLLNILQANSRLKEIWKIRKIPRNLIFFYENLLRSISQILDLMEPNTKTS